MKKFLLMITLLLAFGFAQAQNDIKARIEFEEAEKAFQAEDYEKALKHLKETEKLIGQWTPMTAYLKIEAMHAVTDMGAFSDAYLQPLYKEVSKYMTHMNAINSEDVPTEKYKAVYEIEKVLNAYNFPERESVDFSKAKEVHDAGDYDAAIPLYEKLALKGNSWAMRNIGMIYQYNKIDTAQAFAWYKKAVENGSAQAAVDVAAFNVEGGSNEAAKWYKKGLEMGHPKSFAFMGIQVEIMDENFSKALEYYQRAVELGAAAGSLQLAKMYDDGKGVPVDKKKAFENYKIAAQKGLLSAMYSLGILYFDGKGVEKNTQKAMESWQNAAENGHTASMRMIGWVHEGGLAGFTKDYTKAAEWYTKMGERGGDEGYIPLGKLYSLSDNDQPQKALANFEKAAEANYLTGMMETASLYYSGKGGIMKDFAKAAKYYEIYYSNKKSNESYLDSLIDIYNRGGNGITKDKEKAKYWKNIRKQ